MMPTADAPPAVIRKNKQKAEKNMRFKLLPSTHSLQFIFFWALYCDRNFEAK